MHTLFPQAAGKCTNGGITQLDAMQAHFRSEQVTGLIDAGSKGDSQIILIFSRGGLAGAYRVQDAQYQAILAADIPTFWDQSKTSLRSLKLPETAARLLWVALDSLPGEQFEIQGEDEWQDWLDVRRRESNDGLVEITSDSCSGYFYLRAGVPVPTEKIFVTSGGFQSEYPPILPSAPWRVMLRHPNPTAQSAQTLFLRTSLGQWARRFLKRYQEMVGQRLMVMLNKDLNAQLEPWEGIQMNGNAIDDQRFIPQVSQAVEAYRALFMGIGSHCSTVIGSNLTQRMLIESYVQLKQNERTLLEVYRLIPDALVA